MDPVFTQVTEESQVRAVAVLALEIWRQHYTPILGTAQVEYMLTRFQSVDAIERQMHEEGYRYFLISDRQEYVGYFGVQVSDGRLFLSKFYVKAAERGKGYGKRAMEFVERLARDAGCSSITLAVNKKNTDSVAVYERLGFKISKAIVMDIGSGFVMDDYLMERSLYEE